jgi:hypothetical protein
MLAFFIMQREQYFQLALSVVAVIFFANKKNSIIFAPAKHSRAIKKHRESKNFLLFTICKIQKI